MQKHGVDFAVHFSRQNALLKLERVSCDRPLRLDTRGSEFRAALAGIGLPDEMRARPGSMPHSNANADRDPEATLLTDGVKAMIRDLCSDDFARPGYMV